MPQFVLYETDESCEAFALYENGQLVLEGEWVNDYLTDILEKVGVEVRKDEAFLMGDENGETIAKTLAEIEAYEGMPRWERQARQLESDASHLDNQADELRRQAERTRRDQRL